MKILQIALGTLAVIAGSALAQKQSYGGWLIYPRERPSPIIELPTEKGPWRLLRHDRSLIVEMPQPPLKKGYTWNHGECRIDGVFRHDLIAMVKYSNGPGWDWSKDVAALWIADPKAKRFVPHPVRGVECNNQSSGD